MEIKMTSDVQWLRERDGVYVVDMTVGLFGRLGMKRGLDVQMTQPRDMERGTLESCTRWKMPRRWMRT